MGEIQNVLVGVRVLDKREITLNSCGYYKDITSD